MQVSKSPLGLHARLTEDDPDDLEEVSIRNCAFFQIGEGDTGGLALEARAQALPIVLTEVGRNLRVSSA